MRKFSAEIIRDSALIVIDMQRYFLRPGADAFLNAPDELLPNVQKLIEYFRSIGKPVIFTRHANRRDSKPGQMQRWWGEELPFEGDPDTALGDGISPTAGEIVITKETYSAFENTLLNETLRDGGVDALVICGVMTNVCVETTARHAFIKGYQPVVVRDACAGKNSLHHEASLMNLSYAFAYTPSTYEIIL